MNIQHKEAGFLSLGPKGFHRIAYTQWGNGDSKRVVVCVHGLTRNGRDFDDLAEDLTSDFRVACPDLPGRGHSHWLSDPQDYVMPVYMADMAALIAHLGVEQVDWIGTSLGGLIGMMLAAQPNSPIRSLVINDVGPVIPRKAIKRIASYAGHKEPFSDFASLKTHLMNVGATFGPMTDEQWDRLCRHSARQNDDGSWRMHYDPAISIPFRKLRFKRFNLWPVWEAITCPVLILRGELSDVLPRDIAEKMLTRGPSADLVEIPGVGHAPALMDKIQIKTVGNWLRAQRP
ncbi:MAG: alpha/beta hydrolase [Rhodospirillaceae bacterium]|nr:alpha/beta hydrolase [Rhodospirillaceae bacterium]